MNLNFFQNQRIRLSRSGYFRQLVAMKKVRRAVWKISFDQDRTIIKTGSFFMGE